MLPSPPPSSHTDMRNPHRPHHQEPQISSCAQCGCVSGAIPTRQLRLLNCLIAFLALGTLGNILFTGRRLGASFPREMHLFSRNSPIFLRTTDWSSTTDSNGLKSGDSANRVNGKNTISDRNDQQPQRLNNGGHTKNIPGLKDFGVVIRDQQIILKELAKELQENQPNQFNQRLQQLRTHLQSDKPEDLNKNQNHVEMPPPPAHIINNANEQQAKVQQLKGQILQLERDQVFSKKDHPVYFERLKIIEEQQELVEKLVARLKKNRVDLQQKLQDVSTRLSTPGAPLTQQQQQQYQDLMLKSQKVLKIHEEQTQQQLYRHKEQEKKFQDAQKLVDPQKQLGLAELREQQQKEIKILSEEQDQQKQDLQKEKEALQGEQPRLKDLQKEKESHQQQADEKQPISQEPKSTQVRHPPRFPEMSLFKFTWDPMEATDLPVFWHIPKAGGSNFKDLLRLCHSLCMASEAGIADGHDQDSEIAVVEVVVNPGQEPSCFVNVDTTTPLGLFRAKQLGLAESGLADVVVTPLIKNSNLLFDTDHQGRVFTIFRHPVDRAMSIFHQQKHLNKEIADMTIEQLAQSRYMEGNWVVRQLSNKLTGELTEEHLEIAMDKVRRKILVGLSSRTNESLVRFEKFFSWKFSNNPSDREQCRQNLINSGANSHQNAVKLDPNNDAYKLLARLNKFDLELYEYVEKLFDEQGSFVEKIPDGHHMGSAG